MLLGTATSAGTTDGIAAGPLGYGYVIPAAMGIILGAVYMLSMCRCVLFGPLKEPPNTPDTSTGLTQDLTRRELAILAPIALVCIWLGVYPKPLLNTIEPAIVQNILCATDRPLHAFEDNGRANQLVTTSVAPAGNVARAGMLATVPSNVRPAGTSVKLPSNVKPAGTSADSGPINPEPRASARAVFPISTEPRVSSRAMPQRSILLHKFHDYPSRRIQPARTCDRGQRSRPSVTSRGLKPAARRRITVARYTRQGSSDALDRRNVFPNTNEPLHSTEADADAR